MTIFFFTTEKNIYHSRNADRIHSILGSKCYTCCLLGSTTVEGRQAEERQVEGGQAEDRQAESRQGGWLAAGKQTGGGQAQGWLAAGKQTVGGLTQERQTEEGQAQGRQAERGQPQERQAEGRQAVGWLAGGRQADGGQAQERQPEGRTRQYFTNLSSSTEYPQSSSNTSLPVDVAKSSRSGPLAQRSANALKMKNDFRQTSPIGAHTSPMSSLPSFDEKVLRNVGLSSCSKVRFNLFNKACKIVASGM